MSSNHEKHYASVPVSTMMLTIVWCHHCYGWYASAWATTLTAEDASTCWHNAELHFGPFDQAGDVRDWLMNELDVMLASPRRPWV
jgi:hypothetical protein